MHLQEKAYLLHRRPYRNTSLLLDFLTESQGRLCVLMKGALNKSKRHVPDVFIPYWIDYKKNDGLSLLNKIESCGQSFMLPGKSIYCGFYLNELLCRLLITDYSVPEIYLDYQYSLQAMKTEAIIEPTLRNFELNLLMHLGYALPLECDCDSGEPIEANSHYVYSVDKGFHKAALLNKQNSKQKMFKGELLYGIALRQWENAEVLQAAKQILRLSIEHLLDYKPLNSRKFFRK